jgi:hypothetical protein
MQWHILEQYNVARQRNKEKFWSPHLSMKLLAFFRHSMSYKRKFSNPMRLKSAEKFNVKSIDNE